MPSLIMVLQCFRRVCCTSRSDGLPLQEIGKDIPSRCRVSCVPCDGRRLLPWNSPRHALIIYCARRHQVGNVCSQKKGPCSLPSLFALVLKPLVVTLL